MRSTDQATTRTGTGGEAQPGFRGASLLFRPAVALITLAVSLILTGLAWHVSNRSLRRGAEKRFEALVAEMAELIQERLRHYEHVLRASVGVFIASEKVSREEWHHYFTAAKLPTDHPGIHFIGLAVPVRADQLEAHLRLIRDQGSPDYTIRPPGARPLSTPLVHVEPFDDLNRQALGFDVYSDPRGRVAVDRAIDTGQPTTCDAIAPVNSSAANAPPGFTYILPFYRPGVPTETVEQRRAACTGLLLATFRTHALIQGALPKESTGIRFQLFEGATPAPEALRYDGAAEQQNSAGAPPRRPRARFARSTALELADRRWTLRCESEPGFVAWAEYASATAVAAGGVAVGLIWFFLVNASSRRHRMDESARFRAEEEAHRAQSADRLKSAFLATMSHELRTPLNSIIGFTGVLLQGLAGPLNPEQRRQLGMVRDSGRHLLTLINDVLDLSKIEAGELRVTCEPFEVPALIERVTASVRPLAEQKGLLLRWQVAPEVVGAVSDQRRVEQILLNLLSNAIKFTEHGEVSLEVKTERSESAAAPHPAHLVFRVTDTGIGINAEDLPTLFKPFRQIDTGPARPHEGTGLGLAISRRLANLLGGEIHVESQRGRGSVFTLTLPCRPPGRTTMPPATGAPTAASSAGRAEVAAGSEAAPVAPLPIRAP